MRRYRRLLLDPHIFQAISAYMQRRDRRTPLTHILTSDYIRDVKSYNLSVGEPKITRTRRAEALYKLVNATPDDQLLIVGPRDVHELLLAWCYGFSWDKITGLDLYSRNPKIVVGDAANTMFPARSFSVIVSSMTFSYFKDPDAGVAEMARILQPQGVLIFNGTYNATSSWHGNHVKDWRPYLLKHGLSTFHHHTYVKRENAVITTYGAIK
jgi:SAM-dependent methyltransferase